VESNVDLMGVAALAELVLPHLLVIIILVFANIHLLLVFQIVAEKIVVLMGVEGLVEIVKHHIHVILILVFVNTNLLRVYLVVAEKHVDQTGVEDLVEPALLLKFATLEFAKHHWDHVRLTVMENSVEMILAGDLVEFVQMAKSVKPTLV